MKLSPVTLEILKNISHFNKNQIFKVGSKIRNISVSKEVFIDVEVSETFTHDFAIYDMQDFLAALSFFKSQPEIDFHSHYLTLSEGSYVSKINYGDPDLFNPSPDDLDVYKMKVKMAEPELKFTLASDRWMDIMRASKIHKVGTFSIYSKDGGIHIAARDLSSDLTNSTTTRLDDVDCDFEFEFNFSTDKIKLLEHLDYEVEISSSMVAIFKHESNEFSISYTIVPDIGSEFNV